MTTKRPLTAGERAAWSFLAGSTDGTASAQLRRLLGWLASNEVGIEDFVAQVEKMGRWAGWSERLRARVAGFKARWSVESWSQELAAQGVGVLCLADEAYPLSLRFTPDGPAVLFYQGRPEILSRASLAVVGARQVTVYGREVIKEILAAEIGQLTVVSGMMNGVDELAHRRALELGWPTAAFLGYGLGRVWPARLADLKHDIIAQGGLVASEFAPESEPLAHHFPQRNRLVAGASVATLVVEAAMRSGSLITANLALDYGREVLAVPGSIFNERSLGCLELIKKGATPVTSSQDIVTALTAMRPSFLPDEYWRDFDRCQVESVKSISCNRVEIADPQQQKIYDLLAAKPWTTEDLMAEFGGDQSLLSTLTMMELVGLIARGKDETWTLKKL